MNPEDKFSRWEWFWSGMALVAFVAGLTALILPIYRAANPPAEVLEMDREPVRTTQEYLERERIKEQRELDETP